MRPEPPLLVRPEHILRASPGALLALALVFTLCACDAVGPTPEATPSASGVSATASGVDGPAAVLRVAVWGTSNAQRLYDLGQASFLAAYRTRTGNGVEFFDAAYGGRRLVPDNDPGGDWHPASTHEIYDEAVHATQQFFSQNGRGVILWNQGNDFLDILHGQTTQAQYDAALVDLLDAAARDFPGIRVFLIGATSLVSNPPVVQVFREHERAVCEAHPNCTVAASVTDQILAAYRACDTPACERQWFADDRLHWGPAAVDLVMETAARTIATSGMNADFYAPHRGTGRFPPVTAPA